MESSQLSSQAGCESTASPDSLGWGSRTQRDSVSEERREDEIRERMLERKLESYRLDCASL